MNNKDVLSVLCQFYASSPMPAAIICGEVIWENEAFGKLFASSEGAKEKFFSDIRDKNGTCYEKCGTDIYTVNVLAAEGVILAEVTGKDDIASLMNRPEFFDYVRYLTENMRGSISSAAAELNVILNEFAAASADKKALEARVAGINGYLADILSGFIEPEQLAYLMSGEYKESTVCVADEVSKAIKDIESALEGRIEFEHKYMCSAYARMSRSAFRVIITDAVAVICKGEYFPDKITVEIGTDEYGRAEVTISSHCPSKRLSSECEPVVIRPCGGMMFDYLCDVFCRRCSSLTTLRQTADGESFSICFPAIVAGYADVSAPEKYKSIGKFDVVSLRFGRK